ncbi:hypothetical protein FNH22_21940 [Fulvivirga sp. M361]|uniref:pentapeptide repeat-containing protein n=1 Tax=Fulvivirga sp. M361 TaxID=2594266 RepID=UPI00117B1F1C|nr:pentapeptide repeat-containing protein [Fulvivirga sp. M361]TRX52377.1 hypothetical protein FNH22_21940 [Fulvivirga sp. M361]
MSKALIYPLLVLLSIFTFHDGLGQRNDIFEDEYRAIEIDTSVIFNFNKYNSLKDLSSDKFHTPADFESIRFNSSKNYSFTTFDRIAHFQGTPFNSLADFRSAKFNSLANFSSADFNSLADFRSANFNSSADFSSADFHSLMDFRNVRFDSLANFAGAKFKDESSFSRMKLPKILILRNVSVNKIIDLSETELSSTMKAEGKKCSLDLRDSPIKKFKLRYEKFCVYRPDSISSEDYEKLTNVYEALLKNFSDNGYRISYETLDKEYQEFTLTKNPNKSWFRKKMDYGLNFLNKHWSDYGYDKSRIWLFTGGFFLLFLLINWLRLPRLAFNVYPIDKISEQLYQNRKYKISLRKKGRYPHFNFSNLILAVYYTALIFFGLRMSTDKIEFKKHFSVGYIFLQYVVGLICLAYLANYIISSNLIGS